MNKSTKSLDLTANEEFVTFSYKGNQITVKTMFSFKDMVFLISKYVEKYFDTTLGFKGSYNYMGAEYELNFNIIDMMTDIVIFDDKDQQLLSLDVLVAHPNLYNEVVVHIENYDVFIDFLLKVVSLITSKEELDKSIGGMLNSIFGKLSETLDNLKDFKITDEQLAKLKELVETASKSDLVQTYKTLSTDRKSVV